MMRHIEGIRVEEYKSLIEEHKKNRSYIFERPLLIFGTIAISMQYIDKTGIIQFILVFMIFIACFNLWFTAHRYKSSARIVAYLHLFHEGELKDVWLGWETSLREYRIWTNRYRKEFGNKIRSTINKNACPDKLQFYYGIWVFHFLLVLFICILILYKSRDEEIVLWLFLVSSTVLILTIFIPLRPMKLQDSIEFEREIWRCIFQKSTLCDDIKTTSANNRSKY